MDDLVIRFPSDEEDARIKRFTVHRYYLASLSLLISAMYGTDSKQSERLLLAQRRLPAYQRIQRRNVPNERELRRLLGIAWASELQSRPPDPAVPEARVRSDAARHSATARNWRKFAENPRGCW